MGYFFYQMGAKKGGREKKLGTKKNFCPWALVFGDLCDASTRYYHAAVVLDVFDWLKKEGEITTKNNLEVYEKKN